MLSKHSSRTFDPRVVYQRSAAAASRWRRVVRTINETLSRSAARRSPYKHRGERMTSQKFPETTFGRTIGLERPFFDDGFHFNFFFLIATNYIVLLVITNLSTHHRRHNLTNRGRRINRPHPGRGPKSRPARTPDPRPSRPVVLAFRNRASGFDCLSIYNRPLSSLSCRLKTPRVPHNDH